MNASKVVDHWNNYCSTAASTGKSNQNPIPRVCVTFCHSPAKESFIFDNGDINQVVMKVTFSN